MLVQKMMVTGNGVNLNVDDANLGEALLAGAGGLFVGTGGPDEETPEPAKNLWEQIQQEFPYFELHQLIMDIFPPPKSLTTFPILPMYLKQPATQVLKDRAQQLLHQFLGPSQAATKLLPHTGRSSSSKYAWEEALINFQEQSLQASLAAEKAKAQNKAKQIALQELKLGIISREEYRAQFGLDKPPAKKCKTILRSIGAELSLALPTDTALEGEEPEARERSDLDFA
ncbi:hypothetical protein FRC01_002227 [Tulasnella sp. 417]|nr:hypothetical protein FRC01_002227 [Tulasnella sp. 417]